MPTINQYWVPTGDGVQGTMLTAATMGFITPDVVSLAGQFIAPSDLAATRRGCVIKGGTTIKIIDSGQTHNVFGVTDDIVIDDLAELLDTGSSFAAGKDYYIFMIVNEAATPKTADFVVSLNASLPGVSGASASNTRKVGGFHTLCVNAGTGMTYNDGGVTKDHPLNGLLAGEILPASFWDLIHRPTCAPDGMVYIDRADEWVDIYLQSGTGADTKSAYQGVLTRSRQQSQHEGDMAAVGKMLLHTSLFTMAALGSNEKTAVAGSSESGATTGGAGGKKDTANRRMVSIYGCEEMCGALWQWTSDISYGAGSSWVADPDAKGSSIYCNSVLAGGDWGNSTYCGSRCRSGNGARSAVNASDGGRGRARSRAVR
jgi:hypothetical protein